MHNIFVLEQNKVVQGLIKSTLSFDPPVFNIVFNKDAQELIELSNKQAATIVFVNIDSNKEFESTIKSLRESDLNQSTPILAFVALKEKLDEQKLKELGVTGFIRKPFEPQVLRTQIQKILEDEFLNIGEDFVFNENAKSQLDQVEMVDHKFIDGLQTPENEEIWSIDKLEDELEPTKVLENNAEEKAEMKEDDLKVELNQADNSVQEISEEENHSDMDILELTEETLEKSELSNQSESVETSTESEETEELEKIDLTDEEEDLEIIDFPEDNELLLDESEDLEVNMEGYENDELEDDELSDDDPETEESDVTLPKGIQVIVEKKQIIKASHIIHERENDVDEFVHNDDFEGSLENLDDTDHSVLGEDERNPHEGMEEIFQVDDFKMDYVEDEGDEDIDSKLLGSDEDDEESDSVDEDMVQEDIEVSFDDVDEDIVIDEIDEEFEFEEFDDEGSSSEEIEMTIDEEPEEEKVTSIIEEYSQEELDESNESSPEDGVLSDDEGEDDEHTRFLEDENGEVISFSENELEDFDGITEESVLQAMEEDEHQNSDAEEDDESEEGDDDDIIQDFGELEDDEDVDDFETFEANLRKGEEEQEEDQDGDIELDSYEEDSAIQSEIGASVTNSVDDFAAVEGTPQIGLEHESRDYSDSLKKRIKNEIYAEFQSVVHHFFEEDVPKIIDRILDEED